MDDLIKWYAERLRTIYTSRTAGDHTFEGLLAEFAKEAKPLLMEAEQAEPTADRFGMPIIRNSSPEAMRLLGY